MKPTFYLSVLLPVLFGIMAVFMLAIGIRGIATKRPFLFPARWFIYVMSLGVLPAITEPVWLLLSDGVISSTGFSVFIWLNPLMFGCVLLMIWYQMKGYIAFGVTDDSFREALTSSLQKLNFPFEEQLSAIRLSSVEADFQVAVQSWMGVGQIKVKQTKHRPLLTQVVNEMNDFFLSTPARANMISCAFYTIMGVFMVFFAVAMAFLEKSL